ncbi:hypothetical protein FXB38_27905 [Bradyrhizobium cytisi]|uniref:Uncharacterized protein n=1 Tax=Bradyrhizobium cytisi TaxID=515489 RepID=A0A5S4WG73_9BRAD|nr:hypothetical protein FXB38_27905 [Bradyrhizobium cytisi]
MAEAWDAAATTTAAGTEAPARYGGHISPPSLRAQRSNPEPFRGRILDCFAALAMTTDVENLRLPTPNPEML